MNLWRRLAWLHVLKWAVLLYVGFEFIDPSHGLVTGFSQAGGQSLPIPQFSLPYDPSQSGNMINSLIVQLNTVLMPLGPNLPGQVNAISLGAGVTGSLAQIGLQPGADANAGIQINPNGSGNIVLFGQSDTGILQFGRITTYIKANALSPCPGMIPNRPPMLGGPGGISTVVTAFRMEADWLGYQYAVPVCGALNTVNGIVSH